MTMLYCHNHAQPFPFEPSNACGCTIVELRNLDGSPPSAESLLEYAVPLLVRLGDFIANGEGRCAVILAARELLEATHASEGLDGAIVAYNRAEESFKQARSRLDAAVQPLLDEAEALAPEEKQRKLEALLAELPNSYPSARRVIEALMERSPSSRRWWW